MLVQIDPAIVGFRGAQNLFRKFEMLRTNTNIDVSVGSNRSVAVQPCGNPTLSQNCVHPRLAQQPKHFLYLLFVNLRLK